MITDIQVVSCMKYDNNKRIELWEFIFWLMTWNEYESVYF